MDPVEVSAVLLAVATGASEAPGGQLWEGVVSLVRRPLRGKWGASNEAAAASSGEAELKAMKQSPGDRRKAVALAEVLLARATADARFDRALRQWWAQAEPVREKLGSVTDPISGGKQRGPVPQGQIFSALAFGTAPALPASLDQAAAMMLLEKLLHAVRPDDDRISGNPAAAGRLADLCGGLPLALQIIAALLAANPAMAAGQLADAMTDEVSRLEALGPDDGGGEARRR